MKKLILLLLTALIACSGKPSPTDVVIAFIGAVRENDSLRVVQYLDIDAYIKNQMMAMTPADSAQVLAEYRTKTIQSLLGDGDIRREWIRKQIVTNAESIVGSTAEVEVSFIDQAIGHQLYTKMQLHKQPDGAWRIIYFR